MVNHVAVGNIASLCHEQGIWLIHISTDYVFDGLSKKPYQINDTTIPQSVYGRSKLEGEMSITNSGCSYLIIRTAWLFSEYGNNFMKTMLKLSSTHSEVSVVGDQIGRPTYAHDLAKAVLSTLKYLDKDMKSGIFHYTSKPECSWAEFAIAIFDESLKQQKSKKIPEVKIINSSDYPTPVKRPAYSSLDSSLFESTFNFKSNEWSDGVTQVIYEWEGAESHAHSKV